MHKSSVRMWSARVAPLVFGIVVLAACGSSETEPAADSATPSSGATSATSPDEDASESSGSERLATGRFSPTDDYEVSGRAAIVQTTDATLLQFTDFVTDSGPDLRVYLIGKGDNPNNIADVTSGFAVGELTAERGDQEFELPSSFDPSDAADATVVIWCEKFSVLFGSAVLA